MEKNERLKVYQPVNEVYCQEVQTTGELDLVEELSIMDRFRKDLLKDSDSIEMRVLDSNVLLIGFIISFSQGIITLITLNDKTYSERMYGPMLLIFLTLTFFSFVPYRLTIRKKAIDLQVFVFRFLALGLPLAFFLVIGQYILYLAGVYSSIGLIPRILNPFLRSLPASLLVYILLAGFIHFSHKKYIRYWGTKVVRQNGEKQHSKALMMMPGVERASFSFGLFVYLLIEGPLLGLPLSFDLGDGTLTVSANFSLILLLISIGTAFYLLFSSIDNWTSGWEDVIVEVMEFQRMSPNLVRACCPNCKKFYSYDMIHIDKTKTVTCQNCAEPFEPEIKTI